MKCEKSDIGIKIAETGLKKKKCSILLVSISQN